MPSRGRSNGSGPRRRKVGSTCCLIGHCLLSTELLVGRCPLKSPACSSFVGARRRRVSAASWSRQRWCRSAPGIGEDEPARCADVGVGLVRTSRCLFGHLLAAICAFDQSRPLPAMVLRASVGTRHRACSRLAQGRGGSSHMSGHGRYDTPTRRLARARSRELSDAALAMILRGTRHDHPSSQRPTPQAANRAGISERRRIATL